MTTNRTATIAETPSEYVAQGAARFTVEVGTPDNPRHIWEGDDRDEAERIAAEWNAK